MDTAPKQAKGFSDGETSISKDGIDTNHPRLKETLIGGLKDNYKKTMMTEEHQTPISPDSPTLLPTHDIDNAYSTNTASEQPDHPETTVKAAPTVPLEGKSQAAMLLGRLIHRLFPALQKISLEGRLRKRGYLKHALCCGMHLLGVCFAFFASSSLDLKGYGTIAACLYLMAMFWGLFISLVLLALGIMRYHDTGKSGRGCVILSSVCIVSFLLARYLWVHSTSSGNVWFAVIVSLAGIFAARMLVVRLLGDSSKEENPWGKSPDDDSTSSSAFLLLYRTQLIVASAPLFLCLILMLAAAVCIPSASIGKESRNGLTATDMTNSTDILQLFQSRTIPLDEAVELLCKYDIIDRFERTTVQTTSGWYYKAETASGEFLRHYMYYKDGEEDITEFPYLLQIVKMSGGGEKLPAKCVEAFIEAGCDVNGKDVDGCSALSYASQNGQTKICQLLLKHGANVNAKDNDGKTALMHASDYKTCEVLLQHGADVNAKDNNGETALVHANDCKTCEVLLQHGADVNAKTNGGWTMLMVAASKEQMYYAASKERTEICRLLLEHGADVNAKDNDGWTALMVAAKDGHTEICRLLLEHGADINAKTNGGWTMLMVAASKEQMYYAASKERTEICRLLLEHGADVNAKGNVDRTALMHAAGWGHTEICRLLLEHGADVNDKNNDGGTALMVAAEWRSSELCELLIQHGAQVNARDKKGNTALTYARYGEVRDVLKAHGAME